VYYRHILNIYYLFTLLNFGRPSESIFCEINGFNNFIDTIYILYIPTAVGYWNKNSEEKNQRNKNENCNTSLKVN